MPRAPIGRPQNLQPALSPSNVSAPQDDFTGGRPVVGVPGGFTGAQQLIKYTVERIAPPDGLLGTHYGSFSVDELGQTYGEGLYKIARHEPGKAVAAEFTQKIGASYGPSRCPNNMGSPRAQQQRPFSSFGRPPMMDRGQQQEEGGAPQAPYRPIYPRQDSGERSLYDFARHTNSASNSAMDKAIEMLGAMHDKSLDQIEAARKSAPETHFTKFLETQQEIMNARFEQERTREIERRAAEEDKYERQRREDRERWERDQDAAKQAHDRELARIKAENDAKIAEARAVAEERERRERQDREDREKRAIEERRFILDLEDKKMALIRQEAEIQHKRLEAELIKSREDMKALQDRASMEIRETRETTSKHIEESSRALQEQLERDREQLDREYKLKERAQDREHELQRELLSMQKESVEKSGGDHIFNTINTVIKEFSKGLEKVVDLKKMEAMTPEAQVVAVTQNGAHQEQPATTEAPVAPAAAAQQPQQQAAQMGAPAETKADAASVGRAIVETKMESVIRENLRKPFFQEVIREWATHVEDAAETGVVDASAFANMFMAMMSDPANAEGRQGCAAFATFMKPRSWKKMYGVLKDALDPDIKANFEKPQAAEFYEQFRSLVIAQIKEYWEQFDSGKRQKESAAAEVVPPQAQAPVEPQAAQAKSEAQDEPPPAVPTRDSLRQQSESDAEPGA